DVGGVRDADTAHRLTRPRNGWVVVDGEPPPRIVGTARPPQLHEDAAHRLAGPVRLAGKLGDEDVHWLIATDHLHALDGDGDGHGKIDRINLVRLRQDRVSDIH